MTTFPSRNPRSRRSRRRTRLRKPRIHKPKPHIATLAASVVVLVSFTLFARGTVLPSHHEDLLPDKSQLQHPVHQHPAFPKPAAGGGVSQTDSNAQPAGTLEGSTVKTVSNNATNSDTAEADRANREDVHTAELVASDGSLFSIEAGESTFAVKEVGKTHDLEVSALHDAHGLSSASIAFFMQISEANLALLPRLLVVMWHPENVYVLHLDTKIPADRTESIMKTIRATPKFANVHFLPQEPITYKGVSMLLNTLSAIEYLLTEHKKWDYFVNLSGSDYPLANVGSMMRILGQDNILARNISFVQVATDKQFWNKMKQSRFDFVYYDTALGMKEMKHELIHTWVPHPILNDVGIEFVQAEAWIIAHRSFAEYSVRSSFSRKLLILLSTMQDPEEHFFAMLGWNTPHLNKTLAHHAFRGIYWEFNGTMSGQHPYYVDEKQDDGTYPFYESRIMTSRCFFTRKFRDPSSELLDRIDQSMSGTHIKPDIKAVSKSLIHMRSFVSCIADVGQIKDRIRAYDSCWFPS